MPLDVPLDVSTLAALLAAAAAAGWIDAVVGGGGLILIPALLIAFPTLAPATMLGTNKFAAMFGTTSAAARYIHAHGIAWRVVAPTAALAVVTAGCGAAIASHVPASYFRPIIMVLLVAVALFVVFRPGFGTHTAGPAAPSRRRVTLAMVLGGGVIALYDGVLGPGTGTFLVITFTALLAQGFVASTVMAKVVNVGTNLGAVAVFASQSHVLWLLGLLLAAGNIVGAQIGAHMAINRGSGFIRAVLLIVVVVMVGKLGYDQFLS